MKVRVRSVNGGETLRLDLPLNCSLQSLKDTIADKISSIPPLIHLSLNKKDELQGFPQEPLQTLGIAGGDLIYYTLSADGFQIADNAETPKRGREEEQNPKSMRELCASAAVKRSSNGEGSNSGTSREICVNDTQDDDDHQLGVESMEVDDEELPLLEKSRSVPCFLERVLLAERENAESGHRLLVMAVHAVMLESGFVRFDLKASEEPGFDGFRLPEGWSTKAMVSLYYTLPELVYDDGKCVESVCVRFSLLGSFLVVYGSLVSVKDSQVYRLSLKVEMFLSALQFAVNSIEAICSGENSTNSLFIEGKKQNENNENFSLHLRDSQRVEMTAGGSSRPEMGVKASSSNCEIGLKASSSHDMCVFELWRIVKDRLSMPVLTALCEKTGLPSPPSLILLPTELKLKILEFLPAMDVAKLGCVCTEFRFLSVNDELWKKKYADELGSFSEVDRPARGRPHGQRWKDWKDAFARDWIMKKKMEAQRRNFRNRYVRQTPRMRLPRYLPVPFPGTGFGISGGDYDRFPAIGDAGFYPGGGMLGSNGRRLWPTGRRHVATSCDFSGLKGDSSL